MMYDVAYSKAMAIGTQSSTVPLLQTKSEFHQRRAFHSRRVPVDKFYGQHKIKYKATGNIVQTLANRLFSILLAMASFRLSGSVLSRMALCCSKPLVSAQLSCQSWLTWLPGGARNQSKIDSVPILWSWTWYSHPNCSAVSIQGKLQTALDWQILGMWPSNLRDGTNRFSSHN